MVFPEALRMKGEQGCEKAVSQEYHSGIAAVSEDDHVKQRGVAGVPGNPRSRPSVMLTIL